MRYLSAGLLGLVAAVSVVNSVHAQSVSDAQVCRFLQESEVQGLSVDTLATLGATQCMEVTNYTPSPVQMVLAAPGAETGRGMVIPAQSQQILLGQSARSSVKLVSDQESAPGALVQVHFGNGVVESLELPAGSRNLKINIAPGNRVFLAE